ncbi:3-hydroxyacyl-CoA dehydrogenase type-2 [Paramyrothecium foliicola]|nr:3-hydroxyacyl-CoA dehydrogenase type-2 [Paramyrothecium foliicola]
MHQFNPSPSELAKLKGQTVIITGAARGIGAAAAVIFNKHGANVVITDLPHQQGVADALLASLDKPNHAIFVPASVTDWKQLVHVFEVTIATFGKVDMVVANAGIMESTKILDMQVDEEGLPLESTDAIKVLDVNLRGTLNTLRLGLHYLSKNPVAEDGSRGSIVLVSSTSGYFGTTGNAAYIASKHGIVGLLRASQQKANGLQIRVNSIAPCYTPTYITASLDDGILKAGVEANTTEIVGVAIAHAAIDDARQGTNCLVAGKYLRELEHTQNPFVNDWLGTDLTEMLARFGSYLASIGGYRLPPMESSS